MLACSSSAKAPPVKEGGADTFVCGASLGADHLTFELSCTSGCTADNKVTFDISPGDREGAPCVDADGHLQFFQLVGNDQSVFTLDINPNYSGAGSYTGFGSMGDVQYSNVPAMCSEVGMTTILLSLPDTTDPKGSCSMDVTEDCTNATGHAISGTFSCQFPVSDRGANCTIKNGSFSFKACE
jgi:hypothetical protein